MRGAATASLTLYMLLTDCARFDLAIAARDALARSPTRDEESLKALDERNALTAARCNGVALDEVDQRLKWLDRAAAGGNEAAKVTYVDAPASAI